MVKTDYAAVLRQRSLEAFDDLESQAPISLTEFKARHDIQRWQQRMAAEKLPKIPRTFPEFLRRRLPRWMVQA